LIEPVDLLLAQEEDPAQHELRHVRRMLLGIRERERAPPRAAEDLPRSERHLFAQPLDVGDEIPRRVLLDRRVRRALSTSALIEQYDAIEVGMEEPPVRRHRSSARTAVQE